MKDLAELESHLSTLTAKDWKKLFAFIDRIEEVNDNKAYELLADNFTTVVYDLGLAPAFDWPHWELGIEIFHSHNFHFSSLSLIDLCKFLTVLIRSDRFVEGNLVAAFEDGTVLSLLKAMKEKAN